jgi:hypothetical protein
VIWPYDSERLKNVHGLNTVLSIDFPAGFEKLTKLSVGTDDLLDNFTSGAHPVRRMIVNHRAAMFCGHKSVKWGFPY